MAATSDFGLHIAHADACIYDDKSVQTVRNVLDAGHELGAHTWTHAHMAKVRNLLGPSWLTLTSSSDIVG